MTYPLGGHGLEYQLEMFYGRRRVLEDRLTTVRALQRISGYLEANAKSGYHLITPVATQTLCGYIRDLVNELGAAHE